MGNIKLVLTDMDGTIVQFGNHAISERVREAVIACEEKGVVVAAVTGRAYEAALPALEILGFDGLSVFDNGASIRDVKTGELVWSNWLEPAMVRQIVGIIFPYSEIITYEPGYKPREPADNEAEIINEITSAAPYVFGHLRADSVDEVISLLEGIPEITYYTAASTQGDATRIGIQINHRQADKFHGVAALRAITGTPQEHTLAIGDGMNDLPLFRNAGLKIAIGNASDGLKAAADHTVGTIDEDGFAEAMERFVLA